MDSYLKRRSFFWADWVQSLERATTELETRSAEKWVEPDDEEAIRNLKEKLRESLLPVMRRYRTVLGSQISELEEISDPSKEK